MMSRKGFVSIFWIAALLFVLSVVPVGAQEEPLPSVEFNNRDVNSKFIATSTVGRNGNAAASATEGNLGGGHAGVPIQEGNSGRSKKSETSATFGGSPYNDRAAAMMSVPMLRNLTNALFGGPLPIFATGIANLDAGALDGFRFANFESYQGARATAQYERDYLEDIRNHKDGKELERAYHYCKEQYVGSEASSDSRTRTRFEAIHQCMGNFRTEAPEQEVTLNTGSQFQTNIYTNYSQLDYPFPVKVELDAERPFGAAVARTYSLTCNPDSSGRDPNCSVFSLWSYIFHHVQEIDESGNVIENGPPHRKNALRDEAKYFYGNGYKRYQSGAEIEEDSGDDEEAAERTAEQTNKVTVSWEFFPPEPRQVGFFGIRTGPKIVRMSGFDLLRATFFKDIYGSMVSLIYSHCGFKIGRMLWGGRDTNGFNNPEDHLRNFWMAPITSDFNGGLSQAPLPSGAERMWPTSMSGFFVGDSTDKRFYEYGPPGENYAQPAYMDTVTWHQLIGNLSNGGVSFSHYDAEALASIFLHKNKDWKELSTEPAICTSMLQNLALGDLMDFEQDRNGNWIIPSATWPMKVDETSAEPPHKGVQLLYSFANTAATLRALQQVENFRILLRREVLANHRFKEAFELASQLVARTLPGGSHQNTSATTLKMAKLSEALVELRKDIHIYRESLRQHAQFSNSLKSVGNMGSTMTGMGN